MLILAAYVLRIARYISPGKWDAIDGPKCARYGRKNREAKPTHDGAWGPDNSYTVRSEIEGENIHHIHQGNTFKRILMGTYL